MVGPVPKGGKVSYADAAIFRAVAKVTGPEIPKGYPKKYTENLQRVDIFNESMAWDIESVHRWDKRNGITPTPEVTAIFDRYIRRGHTIRMMLVEHPKVPAPDLYRACSVVLQRGVIIYDNGRETLFLRSYMHSSKDSRNYVNFVPKGGIKISFRSDNIWFPLETTRVVQEPESYVVLDILTQRPLSEAALPRPFRITNRGKMQYEGKTYVVTRVTARYVIPRFDDLSVKPPM